MRVRSMSPFAAPPSPRPDQPPAPLPAALPRTEKGGILSFLDGMKQDDYILLGIIAVLFFEGCDDYILLAALGYLYFMGIM